MISHSAIYVGQVMHKRLQPFIHEFRYNVYSLLIDLDELAPLNKLSRWLSVNRFNLLSFHESDHGNHEKNNLKQWAVKQCQAAGIDVEGGRIQILCYPRVLGFIFNPISVYYCLNRNQQLRAIIYEVRNTMYDQHSYVLPVVVDDDGRIRHSCDKRMHVSPFIEPQATYHFTLTPPDEKIHVIIRESVASGEILLATHVAKRYALTSKQLHRIIQTFPLLSFKVMGAILWQAFKLWRGGLRVYRRPRQTPKRAVSTTNTTTFAMKDNRRDSTL